MATLTAHRLTQTGPVARRTAGAGVAAGRAESAGPGTVTAGESVSSALTRSHLVPASCDWQFQAVPSHKANLVGPGHQHKGAPIIKERFVDPGGGRGGRPPPAGGWDAKEHVGGRQ